MVKVSHANVSLSIKSYWTRNCKCSTTTVKRKDSTNEQIDDVPNQGTVNDVNQLLSIGSAGPTRFAGWINETGLVKVASLSATMISPTNFVASVPLGVGSNVVNIVAWDSQTNLATNSYGVVITNGIATTLQYDANGNLTNQYASTYTNSYAWDGEDPLVSITRRAAGDPIEYKSEFLYDGFGRRVRIVERTNGVIATNNRYLWCGTEICEKRNSGGGTTEIRYFAHGEHIGTGPLYYTRSPRFHSRTGRRRPKAPGSVRLRSLWPPDKDRGRPGHQLRLHRASLSRRQYAASGDVSGVGFGDGGMVEQGPDRGERWPESICLCR